MEEPRMTTLGSLPADIAKLIRDDAEAAFRDHGAEICRLFRFDDDAFEKLKEALRKLKGVPLKPFMKKVEELDALLYPSEQPGAGGVCVADDDGNATNLDGSPLSGRLKLRDFLAYAQQGSFIHTPTRGFWPVKPIDDAFPRIVLNPDAAPKQQVKVSASKWLNNKRRVEQISWVPNEPEIVEDRLIDEGGWVPYPGVRLFNMYRRPTLVPRPGDVAPWLDHMDMLFGAEATDHLVCWFACVMRGIKVNHAIFMGGDQGIGKDSVLTPVIEAVGSWNHKIIDPTDLFADFNPYLKARLLIIAEARDLGEVDKYSVYNRLKPIIAAPPLTLTVNEKHLRQYRILNSLNLVQMANEMEAMYWPRDDRRNYALWSDVTHENKQPDDYFIGLHKGYYEVGGNEAVADYLLTVDISDFNPKAPPPRTTTWHTIAGMSQAHGTSEVANAIEKVSRKIAKEQGITLKDGEPAPPVAAITIDMLKETGDPVIYDWLRDRSNTKAIGYRLRDCGYVRVENPNDGNGYWFIKGKKQVVYARRDLLPLARQKAAVMLRDAKKSEQKQ